MRGWEKRRRGREKEEKDCHAKISCITLVLGQFRYPNSTSGRIGGDVVERWSGRSYLSKKGVEVPELWVSLERLL